MNNITEFLVHIANIAKTTYDVELNATVVYGELLKFGLDKEECFQNIEKSLNTILEGNKFKKNLRIFVADNWKYYAQFINKNKRVSSRGIKIYLPLKQENFVNNVNEIIDYIDKNDLCVEGKIASHLRADSIVLTFEDLETINKMASFIGNNKKLKDSLAESNPFLMTDNLVGYSIESKIIYNLEVSWYIADFVNEHYMKRTLDLVNADNFYNYLVKKYRETFVTGENLISFKHTRNLKISSVSSFIAYMEAAEQIVISCNPNKNLNDFVAYFYKVNNTEYKLNAYNYMVKLIKKQFNSTNNLEPYMNQEKKEFIVNEAIIEGTKKYGINFTVQAINDYILNNSPRRFTRTSGIREALIQNISAAELAEMIKEGNKGHFNIKEYVENILSDDMFESKKEVFDIADRKGGV